MLAGLIAGRQVQVDFNGCARLDLRVGDVHLGVHRRQELAASWPEHDGRARAAVEARFLLGQAFMTIAAFWLDGDHDGDAAKVGVLLDKLAGGLKRGKGRLSHCVFVAFRCMIAALKASHWPSLPTPSCSTRRRLFLTGEPISFRPGQGVTGYDDH